MVGVFVYIYKPILIRAPSLTPHVRQQQQSLTGRDKSLGRCNNSPNLQLFLIEHIIVRHVIFSRALDVLSRILLS